jgi:hypothetical protein
LRTTPASVVAIPTEGVLVSAPLVDTEGSALSTTPASAVTPLHEDGWLSRTLRGFLRQGRAIVYNWTKKAVLWDLSLAVGLYAVCFGTSLFTPAEWLTALDPLPPAVGWSALVVAGGLAVGFFVGCKHLADEAAYEDLRTDSRPTPRWWHRLFLWRPCTLVVLFAAAGGVASAGFGYGRLTDATVFHLLQLVAPLPPVERLLRWVLQWSGKEPPELTWPGWVQWGTNLVYTSVVIALVAAWFARQKQRSNYVAALFTPTARPADAYGTGGSSPSPHERVLLDKGERIAAAALPFLSVEVSAGDWSPRWVQPDRCRGVVAVLEKVFRTPKANCWQDEPAAADHLTGWLLAHLGRLLELDLGVNDHRLAEAAKAAAAALAARLKHLPTPSARSARDTERLDLFHTHLTRVFRLASGRPPLLLAACEAALYLGEPEDLRLLDAQTRRLHEAHQYTPEQTDTILKTRDRIFDRPEQRRRLVEAATRQAAQKGLKPVPVAAGAPLRFRREDGAEMVLVVAGSFVRGYQHGNTSGPQRRVYLDTYLIDVEPVPQEQFGRWVGDRGSVLRLERGFFPVQAIPAAANELAHAGHVSWFAAREYARAMVNGGELPTEAQWEKAVRGTNDARRYPGGDNWVDGARSPYGLAACHLLEWTRDAYDDRAYRLPHLFDPVREAEAGEEADRVVRGRTPDGDPAGFSVWDRLRSDPLTAGFTNPIGFRVVVHLPTEEEA